MKKTKLGFFIIYYNIIPLIIMGICFFAFRGYLSELLCMALNVTDKSTLYNLTGYGVNALLLFTWSAITFTTIRDCQYKRLTGRSYPKDRNEFNTKTYFELVEFFTTNDTYKMDVDELPIIDWHNADGIILCKVKDIAGNYRLVNRPSFADGNAISFGLPGSGKSTCEGATSALRFNSKLRNGGCGVFAISIKGDLLNFLRGKRKNLRIFTPDKAEGSCHYNPLAGLSKMNDTERRSFIENLSTIICPDESGDNAAFWVNGARDYFCAICFYLLYLHDTGARKGILKFPELVDAVIDGDPFTVATTIKDSGCKIAGEYTNSYIGSSEKNTAGVYNHLVKSIRPCIAGALRTLFDGNGDCIKPNDLNKGDVIIDVPQEKYQIYAKAMSIIVSNFLIAEMQKDDVSSAKKVIPHLYLLDEFVQLHLPFDSVLSPALMTLRSKKTSLFMLLQSVASLEACYGEAHAREIIDLCAYISVFNAQDPKSRKYFQELIGTRKMLKKSSSKSTSANRNDTAGSNISVVDEYIIPAADFGDLSIKDKKTKKVTKRVMVYANGKYILGETTPCYE